MERSVDKRSDSAVREQIVWCAMCEACNKQIHELKQQQRDLWAEQFQVATALKGADRDIAGYARAIALLQVQVRVLEQAERRHRHELVRDATAEPVVIPRERPGVEPLTDLERGVGS